MFIDKNKKRVNIYAPYALEDGTKVPHLMVPGDRELFGITEIPDPIPPNDYSDETYYRSELNEEPYVIYTKKSPEQLQKIVDDKALYAAKQHLINTDYLFTVDKYSQLSTQRKAELESSRETARQVIRDYELKYPNGVNI